MQETENTLAKNDTQTLHLGIDQRNATGISSNVKMNMTGLNLNRLLDKDGDVKKKTKTISNSKDVYGSLMQINKTLLEQRW